MSLASAVAQTSSEEPEAVSAGDSDPADTTGVFPDSAATDSLVADLPPAPMPVTDLDPMDPLWMDGGRGLAAWTSSAGFELGESLAREFLLDREIAGSVVAMPERPWRSGAGWDGWTVLDGGIPWEDPAAPFPVVARWSPSWVESVTYLPYDPVHAPLASGASGILRVRTLDPGQGTPSAVRLASGTYDTTTEEALVERGLLGNRVGLFFGNYRSSGRDVIGPSSGQNVLLRVTRPVSRSWLRGSYGNRESRVQFTNSRDLRWEEGIFRGLGGWPIGPTHLEGRLQYARQLWRWRGESGTTRRRETSYEASLFWHWPLPGGQSVVAATRVKRVSRTWDAPGRERVERDAPGTAVAAGWRSESEVSRLRVSAGLEARDHDGGTLHPVGSAGIRRALGGPTHLRAEAWSAVEVPVPRTTANDYEVILLRGAPEEIGGLPAGPVRLHHAEIALGLSEDGPGASRSSPGAGRAELAVVYEGRDTDDDRLALEARAKVLLPLTFWLEGRAWKLLQPGDAMSRDWLPEWSAQTVFGTSVLLFGGDMQLEGRLTWSARGAWSTPFGPVDADDNVDGEIRAWIGEAVVFLILRNMQDDIRESSSFDEGWVPRPRRNGALGVTWRFSN